MLVIGDGLKELCTKFQITSDTSGVEKFSIGVRLGSTAIRFRQGQAPILVTQNVREEDIEHINLEQSPLLIPPGEGVLACTAESISIPKGFFGLVQTKGTLARFLVQITCCDGQVEPGYTGKITLEISNLNKRPVQIPALTPVGQIFLFKTSPKSIDEYNGRYQSAAGPTLPRPIIG